MKERKKRRARERARGREGNRAAEGASRRDFKDKKEPAKLTEQARTDSCVKCRHREPEMF